MTDEQDDPVAARLHVEATLEAGVAVPLDGPQAHYLRAVLRLGPGDSVALFNVAGDGRRPGQVGRALVPERRTRPQDAAADLWLLFAPIKRGRIDGWSRRRPNWASPSCFRS